MNISEKELEDYLVGHLDKIAWDNTELKYLDRQVRLDGGAIDILAEVVCGEDSDICVIELKTCGLDDSAVGQIIRYGGLVADRLELGPTDKPSLILVGAACPSSILRGCVSVGIAAWVYDLTFDGVVFKSLTDEVFQTAWDRARAKYRLSRQNEEASRDIADE